MIKEIRRELKRQLQEMMQFKFNLFFSNFGILIMVSAYLQYFKNTQSKFLLLCLLFTWYFVHKISLNWFNNSWKFTYSSLLLLSILNIKADTYAFPGIMMVLLMFLSLFGSEGKNIVLFRKTEMKYV